MEKRFFTTTIVVLLLCLTTPARAEHGDGVDDALQYVPYASLVVLKAAGVESRHQWPQLLATAAASWVASAGTTYVLKHTIHEWRPDSTDRRSFPSGHAAFAFAGATALRHEYGQLSPWIAVGGYAIATATAIDRVRRDRHHWYDVCAGAAVGIGATELTYWLSDRLFPNKNIKLSFNGNRFDLALRLP